MPSRTIAALTPFALIAAAACSSETPSDIPSSGNSTTATTSGSGATGGGDGRAYFNANVRPILDNDSNGDWCASCHSTKYDTPYTTVAFLGASPDGYYDTLVANIRMVNAEPGNSLLLLKGPHTGPALTDPQATAIRAWLEIEKARFGGGSGNPGTDPGITCAEAEEQFGQCMKLVDWQATGMPDVSLMHSFKEGKDQGPCFKCHASGGGGNFMADPNVPADIEQIFELMKKPPFIEKLITCQIDPTTGYFQDLIQSNRWKDKGVEVEIHPKYSLDSTYIESIDNWFDLMIQQWKNSNGQCQ